MFTLRTSLNWLKFHNFKCNKVDVKKDYFRFRQFDPSPYHRFRTIQLTEGIKAILQF